MNMRICLKCDKSSPFWSGRCSRRAKPARPAVSEFGSHSNTNSEHTKSTAFRTGTKHVLRRKYTLVFNMSAKGKDQRLILRSKFRDF